MTDDEMMTVWAIGTNKEMLGVGRYSVTLEYLYSNIGKIVVFKDTPDSLPNFGGELIEITPDEGYGVSVDILLKPMDSIVQ